MKQLNRIKIVLVEKNKTAKWLSEQVGRNVTSVSRWCTNASQPDLETLFRIAELLDVDVTGCNPNKIYRTICVFANDFDNIGGGYITVGVQEEKNTGITQRPVTDVPIEEFDKIQRDMIGFNHKIEPLNDAINNNARLVLLAISRTPLIKRKLLLDNIDISKATLERILKQLSSEPLGLVEY